MLLGITLILVIALIVLVLFLFKPPTALVLPIGAILIAVIALLGSIIDGNVHYALSTILSKVIGGGMGRLFVPIIAVFLGAVIAQQVTDAGITSKILAYGAEFAGESVFFLTVTLFVITALLFTNIGGLGAVIMVASTIVPLMLAIGLDRLTAGGVFLLGLSLGGILNPVNWQFYISILELEVSEIIPFALALSGAFFAVSILFILLRIIRTVGLKQAELFWLLGISAVALLLGWLSFTSSSFTLALKTLLFYTLVSGLTLLLLGLAIRLISRGKVLPGRVNVISVFALLFPVLLILTVNLGNYLVAGAGREAFSLDIISALFLGVIFAHLSTLKFAGGETNRLMKALYDGFKMAVPAILLLFGIGMLLEATTLSEVSSAMHPLIQSLVPRNSFAYVAIFSILSPLALYRGPLNLYGMGSGIMGLILKTGALSPQLLMGAFFSVGMMQGVCDPTNTHNAWLAGFLGVRVTDLTRVTILFVFVIVLLGLVIAQAVF